MGSCEGFFIHSRDKCLPCCLHQVEPQSSGIGGGAFLLHFNGKDKKRLMAGKLPQPGQMKTFFWLPTANPLLSWRPL